MLQSRVRAIVATVMTLLAAAAFAEQGFAQVNPQTFGTWKLNVARSVYRLGPPPADQTQHYEPAGDGVKVSVETVTTDGARIVYGYTADVDGREYPMEGALTPNGADTIALARLDPLTLRATLRSGPEVVLTVRIQLSADGRVLTLTSTGTNRNEQPTESVAVFDKQ